MSGPTIYASNGKEQFTKENPAKVSLADSDIQVPMQKQSILTKLVQVHNNVLIAPNTWNISTGWIDCSKFDKLGITFLNDASTSSAVSVLWSNDQSVSHGEEATLTPASVLRRASVVDVKAPYVKLSIQNADTVAHTVSSWIYLKA